MNPQKIPPSSLPSHLSGVIRIFAVQAPKPVHVIDRVANPRTFAYKDWLSPIRTSAAWDDCRFSDHSDVDWRLRI